MGIKILYLTGDNLYREQKGKIRTDFPGSVQNEKEGQMHSLVPNPVFPEMEAKFYRTWEDFTQAPTPKVIRQTEKSLMVCVDNDSFPKGPLRISEKDREEIRENAKTAMLQEALHRARDKAEQEDRGIQSMIVITAAAIAGFATIVVGLLFLTGKAGGS